MPRSRSAGGVGVELLVKAGNELVRLGGSALAGGWGWVPYGLMRWSLERSKVNEPASVERRQSGESGKCSKSQGRNGGEDRGRKTED